MGTKAAPPRLGIRVFLGDERSRPGCGPVFLRWRHNLIFLLIEMNFADNVPDDASVIRDVLTGNINSFEILIDRYQDHVAQIVRNHVPRNETPEVAQDTFIRAYQSLGSFKATSPFKHWLSKIAVRCCYDFWRGYYRRQREFVCPLSSDDCSGLVGHLLSDRSLEQEKERMEARNLLQWALGQLSAAERIVLTLTHLNEYSVREAAVLLGWSVPRVKIQSHRARRKLRGILSTILRPKKGET
jgi:RNA polymerase sigma-70 factor (ECF subfamily)